MIEKAKIKKQYAKVLQKEGLSSGRLGDGSRRRGERDAGEVKSKTKNTAKGKGKATPSGSDDEGKAGAASDDSDYDSDDDMLGAEGAAFAKAMRAAARGRAGSEEPAQEPKLHGDEKRMGRAGPAPGDKPHRERGGKGDRDFASRGKGKFSSDRNNNSNSNDRQGGRRPFKRDDAPHAASAARARGVLPPEPTVAPKEGSMRTLKKEAFGKFQRAPTAKTNATGRKGQPNMSARMDMLLEKIRRTK